MFEALKAGAVCHQQIKEWLLHDIDPEYRIVTVPRCEGCPGCKARALVREIEEDNK
jgi:hypothetical protein